MKRPTAVPAPAAGAWLHFLLRQLAIQAGRDVARIPRWPETSVHALRKRMKKMQALLRLLPRPHHAEALTSLRAAVRQLKAAVAAQRDADVMAALHRELGHKAAMKRHADMSHLAEAQALAAEVSRLIKGIDLQTLTWQAVAAGTLENCTRVQRAWERAQEKDSSHLLHEWRKRLKVHYHQMLTLDRWLKQPRHLLRIRRLGSLLGRCHDLDVFAEAVAHEKSPEADKLAKRLAKKRRRLVDEVFSCAEKRMPRLASRLERRLAQRLPISANAPRRSSRGRRAPRSH